MGKRRLERSVTRLNQLCFSAGVVIHEKKRAVRSGATDKRFDAVGIHKPETRRAGPVWPNIVGLWLGRIPIRPSPKPLILNQTCSGTMVQFRHRTLWIGTTVPTM